MKPQKFFITVVGKKKNTCQHATVGFQIGQWLTVHYNKDAGVWVLSHKPTGLLFNTYATKTTAMKTAFVLKNSGINLNSVLDKRLRKSLTGDGELWRKVHYIAVHCPKYKIHW